MRRIENMIKAVLFDFDGVLTLDEYGSDSICNYISNKTGIDKTVFMNEYRKYNGDLSAGKATHEEIWQKLCDGLERQIDISILHESFINTPINTEMLNLARNIKGKHYKTGIVTDNKSDRIKSIKAHYNLEKIFDSIAVSADIGSGKRHEHIFKWIFQELAVNPDECVFIDNTKENLVIPEKLGVKAIFFDFAKSDIDELKNELILLGVED
jgi:putative hydrolase of the HAD superfamily